jgi:hypothetical protein
MQRCIGNHQRFFAKPVLSEAEGLRMADCLLLLFNASINAAREFVANVL